MVSTYATDFAGIPSAVLNNSQLGDRILNLIDSENIDGKVLQGGNRPDDFKAILKDFFLGKITLEAAIKDTEVRLPRSSSSHSSSNRVFPNNWAERLVRTQVSRFYNQAVLEEIISNGDDSCFVGHSSEGGKSNCALFADKTYSASELLLRLTTSYRDGNYKDKGFKVPNHPHCTHTVQPVRKTKA